MKEGKKLELSNPRKQHIETASETAKDGMLLHLYVEQTTGHLHMEEVAILLQASAESYGLERVPAYSEEAVTRLHAGWRQRVWQSPFAGEAKPVAKLVPEVRVVLNATGKM